MVVLKGAGTYHAVVHDEGKVWGFEEGRDSCKLGDDKFVPQLSPTLAVGTVQYF